MSHLDTNYKMSQIKYHDLDIVDDMYNVSPLSLMGNPDISSLGPYNIWRRYITTHIKEKSYKNF